MATSKRRRFSLLWVGLVLTLASPAVVHAEPTIDVAEAVARALQNNLVVKNAQLDLASKRLVKDTVWNRFVPSVTAGATMSRLNATQQTAPGLVPVNESPAGSGVYTDVFAVPPINLPRWGLGVRLSAQLTLSAQMIFGVRQTVLDYEAGLTSLDEARAKLEEQVRKQFDNLLVLQESIKLQEGAISTATQRLEQTKVNYQNGLVDEYTYLSAQVSLANLHPMLDDLRSAYATALMGFNQIIGLDVAEKPVLVGTIQAAPIPIELTDSGPLAAKFLDRRFDLMALRQAASQLENAVELTRAAFYPTVTFGFTVDPTFIGDPLTDPWFANVQNDWKQISGAFTVTLGLSLDQLLPSSQARVQIAGYRNQLMQVQNNLTQARSAAEIEVRTAVSTLVKARNSLKVRKMNVALAQRALGLAETGYRSGTRDLLDVRSAEQDLQKAQLDELSDQYDYAAALLDLQAALNTPIAEIRNAIHEHPVSK